MCAFKEVTYCFELAELSFYQTVSSGLIHFKNFFIK